MLKNVLDIIAGLFTCNDPAYEFLVDVEATQTGEKLYVEKGWHRIEIFEGEKEFYLANGWTEVVK